MSVYSARAAASTVGNPSGWPSGWTFPPANGNDGPWPPGWPTSYNDRFLAWGTTTAGKYSEDTGATWSNVTLPFATSSTARLMCGTGSLLYYINPGSGAPQTMTCYLSMDGGLTWQTRGTLVLTQGNSTAASACYKNMVYVATMSNSYPGQGGLSVWRSSNGGASWTEKSISVAAGSYAVNALAVLPNGTVIAGCYDSGVVGTEGMVYYVSADSGVTFTEAGHIETGAADYMRWLIAVGTTLIASGTYGLYRSTDTAASWTAISTGTQYGAVAAYGANALAIRNGRLDYSTDSGVTWSAGQVLSCSLTNSHVVTAWANGFAVLAGTTVYTSTGVTGLAATATSPGLSLGLYAVEEA